MSTPPSADGGRRSATLSRHDVLLMRDVAADKLRNARNRAPMYVYAREPVGDRLTVRSGLDDPRDVGSIEHRQVLPARSIDLGAEGSLEVSPLHAFSLEPARLVTDTRGFTGCLTDTGGIVAEISEDYRGAGGT
jgi:hypothetical protein